MVHPTPHVPGMWVVTSPAARDCDVMRQPTENGFLMPSRALAPGRRGPRRWGDEVRLGTGEVCLLGGRQSSPESYLGVWRAVPLTYLHGDSVSLQDMSCGG